MAQINYTVSYQVYLDNDTVEEIHRLNSNDASPSEICKVIMNKTGYSLHTANCIRKVLTQNTYEFDMKIE